MSVDIGDSATLRFEVRDEAGDLTDANVTLTVTAPDGATTTPTPQHPSTGVYTHQLTFTSAGTWRWVWQSTGAVIGVEHGSQDVTPDPPDRPVPLATVQDLEGRIGRALTDTERARAAVLLRDASAQIRAYTRQQFTRATDSVVLRPVGTLLRLPQRPVTAVSQVVALGGGVVPDLTLPPGAWTWDGIDTIDVWPPDTDVWLSLPSHWTDVGWPVDTYKVTYTHGYTVPPDDVVGVCCRMVLAVLLAPTMVEGLVSERIGAYSYQYGQQLGAGSPGATTRLTEVDRAELARYRRSATTIEVRA